MSRQIHYYAVNIAKFVFHIQIKFKNEGFESWDKIKNYIKKIGLVIN